MTDTGEQTTDIIPVHLTDDPDLTGAELQYSLTTAADGGEEIVNKTNSDTTLYDDPADVDSELETILDEELGLTAAEAVDLQSGRFVVEITPDEMPDAGDYVEEIRATWDSGRSFAADPRVVSVGERATGP